nr:hypothetical protein I308_03443 [Cryptococcus tetragattii IND107]
MPRHVVELAEAVYGGESASIGTRDSSSGPEISYIEVFPPTKSWESTSKHSRDMQIFSPHCTCLFSSPQDQLDASSKVKEVYDTGLYRLPLYLQYGRSCFQALELSKGTKSRPAYPSLVLIQTMTKLCYLAPLVTYQGAHLQESWFKVQQEGDRADVEERRKQNEREEKAWKTEDAKRKLDEEDAEQNSRAT